MNAFILGTVLVLGACAHTVDVEDMLEYKCGDQVIETMFLSDDSVIVSLNNNKFVLNKTASEDGVRYDNTNSKVSLRQDGSDTYLSANGINYPLCYEIKK